MATSIAPSELPVIKAAGGILLRSTSGGEETMIVYRNRHQDWTLPKGKLKEGESFPEAALREVEEETGCSCRLGNCLGVISYAHEGVPKVVMFWKMTVLEQNPLAENDEIAEAAWVPIATALERLTHAQEKSLLARAVGVSRQASPAAPATPPSQPEPPAFLQEVGEPKKSSQKDRTTQERLSRELEGFRVELAFLDRRSQQPDKSWAAAADEHLNHGSDCLAGGDIDGALLHLQASRRYAVLGLNGPELAARAQILRDETRKLPSWRSAAIQRLLALPDDMLTPARVAEATSLRDEEFADQRYAAKIAGERLRALLLVCGLGSLLLLPMMFLPGRAGIAPAVLLLGLLGAATAAARSLIQGRGESRTPNIYVMLAPVLFGALASLAGYALHHYLVFTFDPGQPHPSALFAFAFLFGWLGQSVLGRFTPARRQPASRPS